MWHKWLNLKTQQNDLLKTRARLILLKMEECGRFGETFLSVFRVNYQLKKIYI